MKKNSLIIAIACLAVVGILLFASNTDLFIMRDIDTSTQYYEIEKGTNPRKGDVYLKGVESREAVVNDIIAVSWMPGKRSQEIVMAPAFQYNPIPSWEGLIFKDNFASVLMTTWYAYVTYHPETGPPVQIINLKENYHMSEYVTMKQTPDISKFIPGQGFMVDGEYVKASDTGYWHGGWLRGIPGSTMLYVPYHGQDADRWNTFHPQTVSFELNLNRVGKLEIVYVLNTYNRNSDKSGWDGLSRYHWTWQTATNLICTDTVLLKSGEGNIEITSVNSIGNEGVERVQYLEGEDVSDYGSVYTKYVYEEGSKVTMSIDTGYSDGTETGWELQIYDGEGNARADGIWRLGDNIKGRKIEYTIPDGAFKPGTDNEWRVVLRNTLFDQAETRLFVVDSYDKIPGPSTVRTLKDTYNQGETVTVEVNAMANPGGTGEISRFFIEARYHHPHSTHFAFTPRYVQAEQVSGTQYRALVNFKLQSGFDSANTNVFIRTHAMDADGRAGPEGVTNIFSIQTSGTYKITFKVSSGGEPVPNAIITCEERVGITNSIGEAVLYLEPGERPVIVEKDGYQRYTGSVNVDRDKDVIIHLTSYFIPGVSNNLLLIAVALILIGGVLTYLIQTKKLDLKSFKSIRRFRK